MYIGHTLTPPSTTPTYLSIHINNKLTFVKHISILKVFKTFHNIFNINKIRPYITTSTNYYPDFNSVSTILLHTYTTFFPQKYFTTIDRLTNRSLRLIYGLKKLTKLQV